MANTSPLKMVQNGLRKFNLTQPASNIREVATNLNLDINDESCVEPLIEYFVANASAITSPIPSDQPLESALEPSESLTYPITPNTLTIAQKQALTTIQAQQLSLDLTAQEITHISSMVDAEINDSVNYLVAVSELIKAFIAKRNTQAQELINEQITNISTIINQGNDQLGDIFNGANQQLNEIVNQCKQRREDFKSPYSSKLQGIREALKVS